MEYKIKKCLSAKGKAFYQLYVVVDGKDCYVTTFNANRFNRKAIEQITAKENDDK